MTLPVTPSQTVGPFFHIGLAHLCRADFAPASTTGERVTVHGRILDGDGAPVEDALIEVWQADASGRYSRVAHATPFFGFGRVASDSNGVFRFSTIKPGRIVDGTGRAQAPHLAVTVFMRGLLKHLVTRMYFPDDENNANDPVLALVPAERRVTLIAERMETDLEWNIALQGKDETVFFDC
jgi:protocatechuate 3,4-dioxygenase alpha subunit